jgi:hypothetical protein
MTDPDYSFLQNETLNSIARRHSVRMFVDKPVREDRIMAILRTANQAPSAHNKQSWRWFPSAMLTSRPRDQKRSLLIR